jgi:hypothetical protein
MKKTVWQTYSSMQIRELKKNKNKDKQNKKTIVTEEKK